MNFDQAKALRLKQWRSILDDHDFRMQNPEAHRETLRTMVTTLANEGLIDELQQFDLNEMTDAAYWHAVEELQSSPDRYRGASTYDVVKVRSKELLGTISRSIFIRATDHPRGVTATYDGKIYADGNEATLILNPSGEIGRITGLILSMPSGERYELVETKRMINGIVHEPLEDADFYRAMIDVAQVAEECRDLQSYGKLRPLIDLAAFCICPVCRDHFSQRDGCPACDGKGFVTKPKARDLR